MIKVLHITAHLGGGVGRVILNVALYRKKIHSEIEDIIVCLERPHKEHVITTLRNAGVVVEVAPSSEHINHLIETADIIQLEWWHHPLLAQWLSSQKSLFTRLVIWSHTSGLHYPAIPPAFINLPDKFLLTTRASLSHHDRYTNNILDVVPSSGGFDDMPPLKRDFTKKNLHYGYTGTLNPAKLHPKIDEFIEAVDIPGFIIEFYGDPKPHPALAMKTKKNSLLAKRVQINGFVDCIYNVLKQLDVFVYILNPTHYGTTENGLLEAMACGVVPIVLNNPVESLIVKNGETGIVVDSPDDFALAIKRLNNDPLLRQKFSEAASADVRSRFSIEVTEKQLKEHYLHLLDKPKRRFDFRHIFGSTPWEWFSSCLGKYTHLFSLENIDALRQERLKLPVLYEKSKSSVFQFRQYFPDDPLLNRWVEILEDEHASITTP
jgi:glycosyltransferase involved in cell wall biosynthesis